MGGLTRRRVLALVAAGGLLLGLVPVARAATWVEFGTPTAETTFETGLTFEQPVTVSESAGRVELLLTVADAIGPTVIEVPYPSLAGATTLTHRLDPADGHIQPNTPMVARWRLTAADDPADVQVGPEVRVTYADDRFTWKTDAGDLVRVHWYDGSAAFGARSLRIAEEAIQETSELLGVTESEPVDFYIYADQDAFLDAIGPQFTESVGGLANASIRTLFAHIPPGQIDAAWIGIVIPHELAHLVFNTASENPYHFPPKWLNEGLADYVSQGYDRSYRDRIAAEAKAGTIIPLDGLTGSFPTGDGFYLGYAESVSAVDYLVRTYGTDALVGLIRSYAEGRTDDEAFSAALGIDMTAFGDAWLEEIDAKTPTRLGPQPAPPGPVPAAWAAAPGGAVASPVPGGASDAPAPTGLATAAPGIVEEDAVGEVPGWAAPLVAVVGILVVVMLVGASRRSRASMRPS